MKIRKGFVSNSSSSSFIFAIGEITNREQLINRFAGFKPFIGDYIFTKKQLLLDTLYSGHKIWHDLSTGGMEFDVNQLEDDKEYLLLNERGPDGDSYFMNSYDDIDYDIDLSDYEPYQRTIYDSIRSEDAGLKFIDAKFLAGRDG